MTETWIATRDRDTPDDVDVLGSGSWPVARLALLDHLMDEYLIEDGCGHCRSAAEQVIHDLRSAAPDTLFEGDVDGWDYRLALRIKEA